MKRMIAVIVAALVLMAAAGTETAFAKGPPSHGGKNSHRSSQTSKRQKSPGETEWDHAKAGGVKYQKPSKNSRSVFNDSAVHNPNGLVHSTTALQRQGLNPQPLPPGHESTALDRAALNPQPLPPGGGELMQQMLR